jgi:toxin HigB-1
MIKTFRHKGLQTFFETGRKSGIQASHADKIARQLARLNVATVPQDMNIPGWRMHALSGQLIQHYAVWVNANWRITYAFEEGDVILLDYQDYH